MSPKRRNSALFSSWPLFAAALVAIVAIIAFTWWSQNQVEQRTKRDIGNTLSTVLGTTGNAVDDWIRERKIETRIWTQTPEIVFRCQELLDNQGTRQALLNSFAQVRMRLLMSPLLLERGFEKFLLVNPDGLVLAEDQDTLIGTSIQDEIPPRFLGRITQGPPFVAFSLPQESISNGQQDSSMLVGAAVQDTNGIPRCVLMFKIDPEKQFTEILQRGQMGESGESYAFNRAGQLISESRFDDQLREIGLINADQRAILNIEVRDPGGNLVEGYQTDTPQDELPLTFMASRATAGRLGLDLDGYNDYRGVPVIGAWTWDEANGFGIATEIDVAEAFATLRQSRNLAIGATGIAIVLIASLTGLFAWNRVRMAETQDELQELIVNLDASNRRTEAANQAISAMATELETDSVLQTICTELAQALKLPRVDLALTDESGTFMTIASEYVEKGLSPAKGGSIPIDLKTNPYDQKVILEKESLVIPDIRSDPYLSGFHDSSTTRESVSLMVVPLIVKDRTIGALGLHTTEPYVFSPEEIELAQNVAVVAGQAIERANLYETLEEELEERKRTAIELEEAKVAAEAANRAKSVFLANMSHELRTPMNAIIGYSEMLAEDAVDEGYDELIPDLDKINSAGHHLLALISDVLDLSKIEAGQMELSLEHFDVQQMLDETVATITPVVVKNNNVMATNFSENLGSSYADLIKLRQSLLNLLSNAAKFTSNGTVTLAAKREIRGEIDWIVIAVSDTGIGIAEENFNRVFEEFSQADESTTRIYGGTGLGLPISRQFCRLMGGDITLESEPGEGSTFIIEIPAEAKTDAIEKVSAEEVSEEVRVFSNIENPILIIDDDPTAQELLLRTLEIDGYAVVTASTGQEGLELARSLKPSVITLDVMMPGMDGWSVLRELKADPELKHIPVIMISIVADKEIGYALGAVEALTKPIDRYQLLEVVNQYSNSTGSGSVLIVEDDEPTRTLISKSLDQAGWVVAEAANGVEGIEQVSEQKPDLILLDLMMPVMDGFEFVESLRADETNRGIPIIVISAKDLTEEDRQQLLGGVEHIIDKNSYSQDDLLQQVRSLVSQHKADDNKGSRRL